MNCTNVNDSINLYIDGELPSAEQDVLFKHLGACEECRQYFQGLLKLREIEHKEQVAYPEELDRLILTSLRKSGGAKIVPFWRRSFKMSMPLAAAAVIVIVVLSVILRNLLFPGVRTETVKHNAAFAYQETGKATGEIRLPTIYVYPDTIQLRKIAQKARN